jgi:hypothetical protein
VLGSPALASATTGPATFVVDDDGVQCADADFASIQAAVTAAQNSKDVDMVRVCPGFYSESVTISESVMIGKQPLTLKAADRDAIDSLDCFQSTLPELDADQYAIVAPPDQTAPAFALAANDVDLSGFVIQNRSTGMTTSESFSGYRVHHNLFAKNRLGIEFDSGATEASRQESRFDHNCLRENSWGLTVFGALIQARIDHNATFKTVERAFQAAPGLVENVTFDHNESRREGNAYLIQHSTASRIIDNTLEFVGATTIGTGTIAIQVGTPGLPNVPQNQDLEISRNVLVYDPGLPPATGIGFASLPNGDRSTGVLVSSNTITGYQTGIAIGGPPTVGVTTGSLTNSQFLDNVTSNNTQRGIRLRGGNDTLVFRGNVANDNGAYGIDAQCGLVSGELVCPVDNLFRSELHVRQRDEGRQRPGAPVEYVDPEPVSDRRPGWHDLRDRLGRERTTNLRAGPAGLPGRRGGRAKPHAGQHLVKEPTALNGPQRHWIHIRNWR